MRLALFDLDHTLIPLDSDHAWGQFLVQHQIVDPDIYRRQNDHFYEQYQQGQLDIMEYLEFALAPLSRFTVEELELLHRQFMQEFIAPMRLPKADALLQKHRDQGDFLLIITSTNRFVTAPIARALGVDDLLATDPERIGNRYTGKVKGTPCFREGKVERLKQWLEETEHSLDGSYFYSDSINDLPLLEVVTHPVVVDGDERLQAEARQRNWLQLSLRD